MESFIFIMIIESIGAITRVIQIPQLHLFDMGQKDHNKIHWFLLPKDNKERVEIMLKMLYNYRLLVMDRDIVSLR